MDDKYQSLAEKLQAQEPLDPAPVDPTPDPIEPAPVAVAPVDPVSTDPIDPTPDPTDWFDNADPVQILKPVDPTPDPAQVAKDYSALESDPDFQLFMSYKEAGKSIKDMVTEFSPVDVTQLTEEQLFNTLCDQLNIPAEDRENEYELFSQKGAIDRNQILADVRRQIELQNQQKTKGLLDSNTHAAEQQMRIQTAFQTEVDQIATSLKGKALLGLQITDEMSAAIKNDVINFNVMKPDGTIDAETITEMVLLKRYFKDIVKVNVTAAKNKGKAEVIAEVTNPSPVSSQSSNVSATNSPSDAFAGYVGSKKR